MNIFEYEFQEPSQNATKYRPRAVRMYLNNAPIDEITEEEKQSLLASNPTL